MKNASSNFSKTHNREVRKVIKKVLALNLLREGKKGIKIIDENLPRLGQNNLDLLQLKANILDIQLKYNQSAVIYRNILRRVPNHIDVNTDLGDVYQNQGKFRKALTSYNRTLRLIERGNGIRGIFKCDVKGEDFIQAVDGKAGCFMGLKKPKLAVKCVLDALQHYPYDVTLVDRFQSAQEQYQKMKSK